MITALVTFTPMTNRADMSPMEKLELYESTAPKYQDIPGLIRKYFMGNGERAGGWYEWETRAQANAYFTPEWRKFIMETYGTDLTVEFFDCPCVVDNSTGTINIAPEITAMAQALTGGEQ